MVEGGVGAGAVFLAEQNEPKNFFDNCRAHIEK